MSDIKWVDNHIEVTSPKRCKKITGTRFATVMGLNPWATPFEIFCAVTKTYEKPFEDTIYTIAGKTIEPRQAEYMKQSYAMTNLVTPTDVFGEDYFKKTRGDFFHDVEIFGGLWDYLLYENGKPTTVLEMKTTKRSEDWVNDIPEYYALQAALYAYLLGVDDVIMVASFLSAKDYENPDSFVPTATNTITREFKVSERYPNFADMVAQVENWWNAHVVTGISPDFDEKRDKEILDALRTNTIATGDDIDLTTLIAEAETLKIEIDKTTSAIADKEKRLGEINEIIKGYAIGQFREGDKKVELKGHAYTWAISRTESTTIDKKALKDDGLLEKYQKTSEQYRMTVR